MRRIFLLLSMIACLCFMAFSPVVNASSTESMVYPKEQYEEVASTYFQTVVALDDAIIDEYISGGSLDAVTANTIQSWKEVRKELGEYVETTEITVSMEEELVNVVISAQFTQGEGTFTMVLSPDMSILHSATFDRTYTLGEIFEKAALNTVMGMGTVFVVLIFIAFIISLFKYIPDIQAAFSKKKGIREEISQEEAFVEEEDMELADDQELAAVIMAAIYASMEQDGDGRSKDGLVVRSIRKARKR